MGIFLVFFPEEHFNSSTPTSSLSPFKSATIKGFLKRTNSSHIFTRAQSTISICALLIFLTFLLFTLSSFEPNNDFISNHHNLHQYRRYLSQNRPKPRSHSPALQGLGTLYTRGTTAMNELVICHVSESVTTKELKLFMRAFHRSGLAAKSDLLFIFNSISTIDSFDDLIQEENDLFLKLVHRYKTELGNGSKVVDFPASFDVTRFVKPGKEAHKGEPIWGRKMKSNNSSFSNDDNETEFTRTSYGSVVGFGIGELDPENSLSGFLDHVPMSLRRWASYPMVLGRVRRKFKHIILVDVKELLLVGDPLGRVKNHSPESIFLSSIPPTPKHGRKNTKPHRKTINPALILGGERGVRRLSAAMLTEIVRTTTRQQHNKKKNSVAESALLSQLVANEFLQKSIRFITATESIQDPSSLSGVSLANQIVVRRGNSNLDIGAVMMKHICSFPLDSSVYTDC
ncbi:uncharacterized protein LOC112513821 [Cynara cardunculus var. scolymus]|uniref:DUF7780 domain-containing protein n=1 Tax=Cynara cardunculus var. scolymus TaxID=59895 RepID=A0A118K1Y6_CYNCS|nr:uncharacterized protein LOC112513821 [Cynara cardunculus var. scolymus]KVI03495.1 hypothetical protein Ccrd_018208 [Cynara cardunculus var. scolymus]